MKIPSSTSHTAITAFFNLYISHRPTHFLSRNLETPHPHRCNYPHLYRFQPSPPPSPRLAAESETSSIQISTSLSTTSQDTGGPPRIAYISCSRIHLQRPEPRVKPNMECRMRIRTWFAVTSVLLTEVSTASETIVSRVRIKQEGGKKNKLRIYR